MRTEWKLLLAFIGFCVLAIFVAYFAENIRGAKRLEEVIAMAKAEGVPADVPMPLKSSIPEEENFFHGPLIGSLSDFRRAGSVFDGIGDIAFRDPDKVAELSEVFLPRGYGDAPTGSSGIEDGEVADLEWWAGIFRVSPEFTVSDLSLPPGGQCLEALDSRFAVQLSDLEEAATRPHSEVSMIWNTGEDFSLGRVSPAFWYLDGIMRVLSLRYVSAVEMKEWEVASKTLDIVL
ncbi:MAG: hypothetical protein AAGF67_16235, partial [Verrucomicrobiota bacterium]